MAIPGFAEGPEQTPLLPDDGFDRRLDETRALLVRIERGYRPAVFACSFSVEDCVLLDLLAVHAPSVEAITLDTGRLPQETHDLITAYAARGGVRIRVIVPEAADVEAWIAQYGVNGFRDSPQARQACCHARKVAPLARALAGKRAWVTGLRRAQSADRQTVAAEAFDAARGLHKFNPLHAWSNDDVWRYAREHGLPVHALYAQGYSSIGCTPCTRAVTAGEDPRAGRWWWEERIVKECGLHARPLRRLPENAT
ncbi:MAG: phosphoadenylyl-sulfate reductase [Burkholderiales bacterium]